MGRYKGLARCEDDCFSFTLISSFGDPFGTPSSASAFAMLALALGLSIAISPLPLASRERRTIERFTRGHDENSLCWDRDGADGFISPIDAHQHPMPFGGPEVPFREYTDWFIEHGIVFSVFMGIGQRISKQNASLPDCC